MPAECPPPLHPQCQESSTSSGLERHPSTAGSCCSRHAVVPVTHLHGALSVRGAALQHASQGLPQLPLPAGAQSLQGPAVGLGPSAQFNSSTLSLGPSLGGRWPPAAALGLQRWRAGEGLLQLVLLHDSAAHEVVGWHVVIHPKGHRLGKGLLTCKRTWRIYSRIQCGEVTTYHNQGEPRVHQEGHGPPRGNTEHKRGPTLGVARPEVSARACHRRQAGIWHSMQALQVLAADGLPQLSVTRRH